MTTTIITPEILTFARQVRAALHDLPADERDELTDGLEADLAEAYAEDLSRELPDPVEYATELRNAAGLPQSEAPSEAFFATLGVSARRVRHDLGQVVSMNPALKSVADFLVSLRPFWWVARAWVASWLVAAMFGGEGGFVPTGLVFFVVLIGFVVISVQWGRRRWRFTGLAPVIVAGNVLAAALLVPVVAMASSWSTDEGYGYVDDGFVDPIGVSSHGEVVTNIFAYDADGKPLSDVQLFDQDGHPLEVLLDPMNDECLDSECRSGYRADSSSPQAARLVTGTSVFNVFPLSLVAGSVDDFGERTVDPTATPEPPAAPFAQVPAVDRLEKAKTTEKVAPSNE